MIFFFACVRACCFLDIILTLLCTTNLVHCNMQHRLCSCCFEIREKKWKHINISRVPVMISMFHIMQFIVRSTMIMDFPNVHELIGIDFKQNEEEREI